MVATLTEQVAEREEVLGKVRQMLISVLDVQRAPDEIDPDAPLFGTGLGLDSIDAVEVVVSMEELFGVRLSDDAMVRAEMRTVNALVDVVITSRRSRGTG
jgi:acyl carrier protein